MHVSQVEQTITRTLEQQQDSRSLYFRLYKADVSFDFFQSIINWFFVIGFILFFLVSIILLVIFVIIRTSVLSIDELNPLIETASHTFTGSPFGGPFLDSCQSLSITKKNSDEPLVFNVFGFKAGFEEAMYTKIDAIEIDTFLSPKIILKPSNLSFHGDMWLTARFCFHSADWDALLRLYMPKSSYEAKQFDRSSILNPEVIFGVKYQDYRSNGHQTFCSVFQIEGKSLTDNKENAFVFYNLGTSSIFLNLTIITLQPDYREFLAARACRYVTKCDLSTWKSSKIRYLVLSKNDTAASYFKDCVFQCVTDKSWKTKYYVIEAVLVIFGLLFTYSLTFVNKKCTPRLRKWYFKREKIRRRYTDWELSMLIDKRRLEIYLRELKGKISCFF